MPLSSLALYATPTLSMVCVTRATTPPDILDGSPLPPPVKDVPEDMEEVAADVASDAGLTQGLLRVVPHRDGEGDVGGEGDCEQGNKEKRRRTCKVSRAPISNFKHRSQVMRNICPIRTRTYTYVVAVAARYPQHNNNNMGH